MNAHERMAYWIRERLVAQKHHDDPRLPNTADGIIRTYRFCNVRREDDTVSKWIHDHWVKPYEHHPNLLGAIALARYFNRISTLEAIEFPEVVWDLDTFRDRILLAPHPIFGAAYIISTNGIKMDKVDYVLRVCNHVREVAWRTQVWVNLNHLNNVLTDVNGVGSFMGGQLVADAKHAAPFRMANDWHTFAVSGPGSRRGLNRLLGRLLNESWSEKAWHAAMYKAKCELEEQYSELPLLDCQNFQNCLCEFDKFERARLGEGRPKQIYTPARG